MGEVCGGGKRFLPAASASELRFSDSLIQIGQLGDDFLGFVILIWLRLSCGSSFPAQFTTFKQVF